MVWENLFPHTEDTTGGWGTGETKIGSDYWITGEPSPYLTELPSVTNSEEGIRLSVKQVPDNRSFPTPFRVWRTRSGSGDPETDVRVGDVSVLQR